MSHDRSKILSSEEEDLLSRNKKKIKDGGEDFSGQSTGPISYADLDNFNDVERTASFVPDSFRNAVLRQGPGGTHVLHIEEVPIGNDLPMPDQDNDKSTQERVLLEDSSFIKDPEGDEACLVVSIPKIERDCMAQPLSRTLIIKLLGQSISFTSLEKNLKNYGLPKVILKL